MDILKRELVPIPLDARSEIDAHATHSLTATLSERKVVDVTGPMGPDFAGIPEGRLDYPKKKGKDDGAYGIHRVHHLVETRVPLVSPDDLGHMISSIEQVSKTAD